MTNNFALSLMEVFAEDTKVSGQAASRRKLRTDAYAVADDLGLYRGMRDKRDWAAAAI